MGKKDSTVGTITKSNRNSVERGKFNTLSKIWFCNLLSTRKENYYEVKVLPVMVI
jgi:hypothetical protein